MTNRPIKRFGQSVTLITLTDSGPATATDDAPQQRGHEPATAAVQPVPADMLQVLDLGESWNESRLFYVDRADIPDGLEFIRLGNDDYKVNQLESWPTYFRAVGVLTRK